jgi:hypothetical protein
MKTLRYTLWLTIGFLCGLLILTAWPSEAASQVKVQWDYVQGSDLAVTCSVYKSLGCTTSYTKVQTQSASILTWIDTSVTPGNTYCWYVVAVNTAGTESTPSNVLRFQVPSVLSAPTSLRLGP